MNKQLKGIGLILFGILLALIGFGDEMFLAGDYYYILCLAALICGISGIVMTFMKE